MAQAKEIRRRIRSVSNTQQIINAMELVSMVKMQKAIDHNLSSRPYANTADKFLNYLCEGINENDHPFLTKRAVKKKLIVLITSDRGLCGGLNVKVIRKALDEASKNTDTSFVAVGKKGRDFLRQFGFKVEAEFTGINENSEFKEILPLVYLIVEDFLENKFDQIDLIYSKFESTLVQTTACLKLLPFTKPEEACINGEPITFEPEKEELLNNLIPRILEVKIWQAIIESIASEHSARMFAMKNANENADELIDDLTLSFNQTRQADITREIAEISAGKMTLEG